MSRLNDLSLENSAWQSQWSAFTDLYRESVEKLPIIIELAKLLPKEQARILQFLKDKGEVSTKAIAEKIHLSRSAALEHSKKLVRLKFITQRAISSKSLGIKPTYLFSLANDFPVEIIDELIEYKNRKTNKLSNSVVESLVESLLSKDTPNADSKKERDLFFSRLKQLALELPLTAQKILRTVTDSGVTSAEIAKVLECDYTTANKHLKNLLDSGWLTRRKAMPKGMGRSGYAYFPSVGITTELINALLNSSKLSNNSSTLTQSNLAQLEHPTSIHSVYAPEHLVQVQPMPEQDEEEPTSNNTSIFGDKFDESKDSPMNAEYSQQQTAPQSVFSENNQSAGEIMAMIQELLILRRRANKIEEKLRIIGGKQAEDLITTLQSEKI